MIHYFYVLYDRVNEKFLGGGKNRPTTTFTKKLFEARTYGTREKAESIRKKKNNSQNWTVHKVSASLDIDINPTEEEYALWRGGCHVEAYIAYRQRTGLSVIDIVPIFKVVFECNDLEVHHILKMIKSAENTR